MTSGDNGGALTEVVRLPRVLRDAPSVARKAGFTAAALGCRRSRMHHTRLHPTATRHYLGLAKLRWASGGKPRVEIGVRWGRGEREPAGELADWLKLPYWSRGQEGSQNRINTRQVQVYHASRHSPDPANTRQVFSLPV
jgi:hypothetical protein